MNILSFTNIYKQSKIPERKQEHKLALEVKDFTLVNLSGKGDTYCFVMSLLSS